MLLAGYGLVTIGHRVTGIRTSKTPRPDASWIPVFAAFEALDYGAEHLFSRGLVFFEGSGLPGEIGDPGCQARTAPGREDAPAKEAVRALQSGLRRAALEPALKRRVQRFRLLQGHGQLDPPAAPRANGSSPGRCGPALLPRGGRRGRRRGTAATHGRRPPSGRRSEEHTSELQS